MAILLAKRSGMHFFQCTSTFRFAQSTRAVRNVEDVLTLASLWAAAKWFSSCQAAGAAGLADDGSVAGGPGMETE